MSLAPSRRRHGRSSQPVDPAQNLGEELPRHGHLGQLEDHVAAVAHDPGADLHQLLAQRLADRAIKVAAAAHEVGYESEAAFSRAFKKVVGVPPAEWRSHHGPPAAE